MGMLLLLCLVGAVLGGSGPMSVQNFKGTYSEVGVQVGKIYKADITKRLAASDAMRLKELLDTDEGKKIYNDFFTTTSKHFPHYMQELHGMAEGAEVDPQLLFMFNIESEISILHPKGETFKSRGCTDVFSAVNSRHWGHNEDNDRLVVPNSLRHYEIHDTAGMLLENFTAYTYTGLLPGNAFGWNQYLALSTNALFPRYADRSGVPRVFLNRHMYAAKSVEDALDACHNPPLASGFAGNIAALHESRMVTTEVAPTGQNDVRFVPKGGHHYHMNNYLWMKINSRNDTSSYERLVRALELPVPTDWQGVANIIGDNKNKAWPIYRNGAPPDTNVLTLASVHFDLDNKEVDIYYSDPKDNKPDLTFPM